MQDFVSPGAPERVKHRENEYVADGVKREVALTMALFEEAILLIVNNEKAQQGLMAEMETRISKLESQLASQNEEGVNNGSK